MSKRVSKSASQELAFLAALESIHAEVDISKITEIEDWSRAVRGKFQGAVVKDASDLSKLKTDSPSALGHPNATNEQYSEMTIPQLIAVCTSESSEGAWTEFVRRFWPLITRAVTKALHRSGKFSNELVDDLTQDTFIKLCHDNFRVLRAVAIAHENAFLGFLRAVAAHTAEGYFRKAAALKSGGGQALEIDHLPAPQASRDASSEPERRVLLEKIDAILKTHVHEPNFKRDYAIFWLYFRDGLTAKEIAASPGVTLSVKGVESALIRLTRRISVALTQEDEKRS